MINPDICLLTWEIKIEIITMIIVYDIKAYTSSKKQKLKYVARLRVPG
jgi:hypothetical protein